MSLNMGNKPLVVFYSMKSWVDGPRYAYPDTDFCLFAQFPQQNDLTYVLNSLELNTCTNTIKWLLSNYYAQDMSDVFYNFPNSKHIFSICANFSNESLLILSR
jgi:hypothetical protein